jgi:hypothetical protein
LNGQYFMIHSSWRRQISAIIFERNSLSLGGGRTFPSRMDSRRGERLSGKRRERSNFSYRSARHEIQGRKKYHRRNLNRIRNFFLQEPDATKGIHFKLFRTNRIRRPPRKNQPLDFVDTEQDV